MTESISLSQNSLLRIWKLQIMGLTPSDGFDATASNLGQEDSDGDGRGDAYQTQALHCEECLAALLEHHGFAREAAERNIATPGIISTDEDGLCRNHVFYEIKLCNSTIP